MHIYRIIIKRFIIFLKTILKKRIYKKYSLIIIIKLEVHAIY
jgi:hypothetical protein